MNDLIDEETNKIVKDFWYCKLKAEQGDAFAQRMMGETYELGLFKQSVNITKAIYWYKQSAENGDYLSYAALGDIYLNGNGVEKSSKLAFEMYKEGANKGDNVCQYRIGLMYKNGDYVQKDNEWAGKYFLYSAMQENIEAKNEIFRLLKENRECFSSDELLQIITLNPKEEYISRDFDRYFDEKTNKAIS